MTPTVGRRAVLLAMVLLTTNGCATALTLDSTDSDYNRGKTSFQAKQWTEASDRLDKFIKGSCLSEPESGCQNAVWMKVSADMEAGLPAQAIADADLAKHMGPPAPELSPPTTALREKAAGMLADAWR